MSGTRIALGGVLRDVPVLNLALSRKHWATLEAISASDEDIINDGRLAALVGDNLRRADASVTDAQVEEWLDMDTLPAVYAAMKGQGAYRAWCEAQAAAAESTGKNAPALQSPSPGTGAPSSPPSPPSPAGPSPTSPS